MGRMLPTQNKKIKKRKGKKISSYSETLESRRLLPILSPQLRRPFSSTRFCASKGQPKAPTLGPPFHSANPVRMGVAFEVDTIV
jgi:hypothetical protein